MTAEGVVIPNKDLTLSPREPLSYAYCSDTKYFKRLASFVKGVSLLYHEATFDKTKQDLADITCHSTTIDAARTAREASAGKLIIGHFSARYKDVTILVEESRSLFPNTFAAIDGKSYMVDDINTG
jgi:ribonuclease Z